ncbi:hypothetical protein [Streptomyces prasinopilosus]|uniref:hypothetical protein n=1 Tax=Streptomyces prasinopilosus TaxID=67344 RepID=UPI0006EB5D00|nr:hypothetical protein [Streptomyces prasinopilosus]
MEDSQAAAGEGESGKDPAPSVDVEREAERVEAALGLAGHQELPSLALPAAGAQFPAGLARLAAGAQGRERLRLMFAEHPGLPLWLERRVQGQEIMAALELEHGMEAPHPTAVEEAARAASSPRLAVFRRRWAAERRRDYDELQAYLASPTHTAASDQTLAAMMDAFDQQRRR